MSNNNGTENPNHDVAQQATDTTKKAGRKIAEKGKKAIKKAGKKAVAKLGKVAVKGVMKLISISLPYLLPIIAVILIAVAGYYVMYEIKGSEQVYVDDKDAKNEVKKDDNGVRRTESTLLSSGTRDVQNFYAYMSQKSYWQIIGDDNTELVQDENVRDYYQKEQDYLLNQNFLYSMDTLMHKSKFIYPEQFVKPVHYDEEKLVLASLTDKEGNIIVESDGYDEKGNETGKKVKSVSDYGLGSVFKYKKDEKLMTIEGTMYEKEVWDTACNCKKTVKTNEPFSYIMDGYPEDIWLMQKAITFMGEYSFTYKSEKTKQSELTDNSKPGDAKDAVMKVQVGEGRKMKTVEYTVKELNKDGVEVEVTKTKQVLDKLVPLYGYRKGGIYQTIPVLEDTKIKDKGQDYLKDFVFNYQIFTPNSVLDEFNIEAREYTATTDIDLSNIKGGSGVNSAKFKNTLQYFPIVQTYSAMYGVDPYLVLAKMTQESGGNANVEDGLMQITGDGTRQISAFNVQTGNKDSFAVYSEADRRNPEISIRWGVMYFANLTKIMEGDPLKALQAYNFGEGGVLWIKKNYPQAWNTTAWMNYREDSRLHYGGSGSKSASYDCIPDRAKSGSKTYGDSCYVEHVLQYYAGSGVEKVDTKEDDTLLDKAVDLVSGVFEAFTNAVSNFVQNYEEEKVFFPYKRFISDKDLERALDMVIALDNYKLFSEVTDKDSLDEISFWNKDFNATQKTAHSDFVANTSVAGFQIPYNLPGARITSLPGNRIDPVEGGRRYHAGTDIAVPKNTPIYATADGEVYETHTGETYNNNAGLGNYVKINHADGVKSVYGHFTTLAVTAPTTVKKGQLIGYSGSTGHSTGYHLHFEIYQNGIVMDSSLIITGKGTMLIPAP